MKVLMIDESKLTNGTLQMIGQDYGIEGFTGQNIFEYADIVVKQLQNRDKGVVHMSMVGKQFKIAIGSKESLKKCNKILQQVDCYIDGESGILYVVPEEENIFLSNFEIKIRE